MMLEKMESKNPAMAAEVRKRMFLFEDVKTLDDKDLEILIHIFNFVPEAHPVFHPVSPDQILQLVKILPIEDPPGDTRFT